MDPILIGGLWLNAFVAATLLPAASEAALLALVWQHPESAWLLWLTASGGNIAGSLTSYALGRFLPQRRAPSERSLRWLQRHGSAALLLAWLPLVGDVLPLAAGWLRLPFWPCLLYLSAGKAGRYALIIAIWFFSQSAAA